MSGIKKPWMEWLGSCVCLVYVLVTPTPGLAQTQDVDTLIGQLASSSATQRATAACYLGRMRVNDIRLARDELLGLLTDGVEVEGRLCRDYARGWWNGSRFYLSSPGREAAIALEELGTEVLAPLIDRLQGQNPVGRENAAFALGMIESTDAIPALQIAIRDEDVGVRRQVASALGRIESPDAVPALQIAIQDEDAGVRRQAASALGRIESTDAIPALLIAIQDADADVRQQAVSALGRIESPDAIPALLIAIRDEDAGVRQQAASALGRIGGREAAEALADALEDENEAVARQALWALGRVLR